VKFIVPYYNKIRNPTIAIELDLVHIIEPQQKLEVSVTSVIEAHAGELSYWAVTHAGENADFHLRDSFSVSL
jgi:hypothetical protein